MSISALFRAGKRSPGDESVSLPSDSNSFAEVLAGNRLGERKSERECEREGERKEINEGA